MALIGKSVFGHVPSKDSAQPIHPHESDHSLWSAKNPVASG